MRLYPVFIIMLLSLVFASCQHRRESLQIIAQADSVYQQGRVLEDTARLRFAVEHLNHWRDKEALARGYYYIGRNYIDNDPLTASNYFVAAYNAKTEDNCLKGRILTNMAYLCLEKNDSLALYFYKIALDCFVENSDSTYICTRLADIAQAYLYLQQIDSARCFLHKAYRYCTNDEDLGFLYTVASQVNSVEQHYDSVFYYSYKALSLPQADTLWHYRKLMQSYGCTGIRDSARFYSTYLIKLKSSDAALVDAYYHQANVYHEQNNIDSLKMINEKSRDAYQNYVLAEMARGRAVENLQKFKLNESYKNKADIYIICLGILLCIVIICICVISYRKRKYNAQQLEMRKFILDSTIRNFSDSNELKQSVHWNNYRLFCEDINALFFGLTDKVFQLCSLSETEFRLCVLTLLGYSQKEIVNVTSLSLSSIGTLKARAAQKLLTTSKNLKTFLYTLALK